MKDSEGIVDIFFKVENVISTKIFEDVIKDRNLNLKKFNNFYENGIKNNYSRINFFGLDIPNRPREVNLYDLFVIPFYKIKDTNEPGFFDIQWVKNDRIILSDRKELEKYTISPLRLAINNDYNIMKYDNFILENYPVYNFKSLFDNDSNKIILGRPGSGKSSLIKFAICKLIEKDNSIFDSKTIYSKIPFRIELHKYAKLKKKESVTLISYLTNSLHSDFQINFISDNALENLFSNYDTLVFFDGLDEIFDIQDRLNVRNDIENFSNNFDRSQVIVTSRYESYKEVSFTKKNFDVIEIENFNDDQIREYVNKWYKLEENNPDKRTDEIKSCLLELKKVENEIKTNPLFLSLLLLLYRNELELPTSKLDLYESCTRTLIETRDKKEKKMDIPLKVSNKIGVFATLAFWMYENISDQKESLITQHHIKKCIKDYLINKGEFNDESAAEDATNEFLEFARVRSIFLETRFTHKTFLEYFTAYFIFTNYHTKGDKAGRDAIITKYIGQSFWSVVLEMLICKIDRDQLDYEVIDTIIQDQFNHNFFYATQFFVKIVPYFKNISSHKIVLILSSALEYCIGDEKRRKSEALSEINKYFFQMINFSRFKDSIKYVLRDFVSKLNSDEKIQSYTIFYLENSLASKIVSSFLNDFLPPKKIEKDPYISILLNFNKILDKDPQFISDFIKKYGKNSIINSYHSLYGFNIFGGSTELNLIITLLFDNKKFDSFEEIYLLLNKLNIKNSIILKSLSKASTKFTLPVENLLDYHSRTKNREIKTLLNQILAKYYHINLSIVEHKISFFREKELKGRRFPIPK